MPDEPAPKVFISYSHDSDEHARRVLDFADALRRDGIDAILDQYNPVPSEGWPRWMERNLDAADFVLMICTPTYQRRVMGEEEAGVGLGVQWERGIIYNRIYENSSQGHKYLPILLDGADKANIPTPVKGHTSFHLTLFDLHDAQFEKLYRHLTEQAATPKPELGTRKVLPPAPRLQSANEPQKDLPWNVPYTRNQFFTGREDTLDRLRELLSYDESVAITQSAAINGMGGIGKTQTAVEYAYRFRDAYTAVFWMRSENETLLRESLVETARLLELPEANEQDQNITINAVTRWLTSQSGWLVVMDNADDLPMASKFLPKSHKGRVLFTSRASAMGRYAKAVSIEKLSIDDGALLLLRRSTRIDDTAVLDVAAPEDLDAARAISEAVDGLPLALDQAGAYIEATNISPARYLELYQTNAPRLLAEYGNPDEQDHDSVVVTFSLAFEKANADNPAVGDLLRFCAFLAPDDIPEWLFTKSDKDILGEALSDVACDEVAWNTFVGVACRYSLLGRKSDASMLSMHRLVQLVLRHAMNEEDLRGWAERTLELINHIFPNPDFQYWSLCELLISHVLVCRRWITEFSIWTITVARLLNVTAAYLHHRAQYLSAEPLYLEALEIRKRELGSSHPDTATSLNNLGWLYEDQGRYSEVGPLYLEALEIRKRELGSSHPDTASSLNNLAGLYKNQGRYSEAEPLYLEALEIHKRELGSSHPDTATSLNNLAALYGNQGRYSEAKPLYLEALEIRKRELGSSHPDTATSLNNLAALYGDQGRYSEAEPLLVEALEIHKRELGSSHPDTASSLNNLAGLYRSQGRYSEAEPLLVEALEIRRRELGSSHPDTASSLNNLAALYDSQGRYSEAKPLYLEALEIRKRELGLSHPSTANSLSNLAGLYHSQCRYSEAEPLLVEALEIRRRELGSSHPDTASSLNNLAALYNSQGRYSEAESLYLESLEICKRQLSSSHPDTALSLNNLAGLYKNQGRYSEAEPLFVEALAILENILGANHPSTMTVRKNYHALRSQITMLQKKGTSAIDKFLGRGDNQPEIKRRKRR